MEKEKSFQQLVLEQLSICEKDDAPAMLHILHKK